MDVLPIARAVAHIDAALACIPASVPPTWRGPAAQACEQRLGQVRAGVAALSAQAHHAQDLIVVAEEAQLQCVVRR